MAMQDLKKKSPASEPKRLSADDFIAEAERYANGYSNVVRLPVSTIETKPVKLKRQKRFHKVGFTLSPQAIVGLNQLKRQTGVSKSRMLRILIQHIVELSDAELATLLRRLETVA